MPDISRRAQQLGTENAFVVLAEVNALARQGKDIVSFCIGQPDFPAPEHVQEAAIRAIKAGKHGYTPSAGIDELRAAAAKYLAGMRGGLRIRPEDVVAAVRAAAMHSTIKPTLNQVTSAKGSASTTAESANGSAKIVWLNFTKDPTWRTAEVLMAFLRGDVQDWAWQAAPRPCAEGAANATRSAAGLPLDAPNRWPAGPA